MSHPQLGLPQWEGENIWYMYKFMKLQSFMLSDTLCVGLHIPLVNKFLQFNLYRIHNIPLDHPVLRKSFKHSIQEEYLAVRSDSYYISFPLSADIMACQDLNGQFYYIKSTLYVADASKSCSYTLFLNDKEKSVCMLYVINQTQDKAINIYDNF